jgi:hypothetical protein
LRTAELRIGVCCVSRRPLLVSTPFRDDLLRQGHKEQVLELLCCLPIHPLGPTDYFGLKGTVLYSPPPIKRSTGEFRPPRVDNRRPRTASVARQLKTRTKIIIGVVFSQKTRTQGGRYCKTRGRTEFIVDR